VNPAVVQTLWADVIACTLRDAGVPLIVISPGSRSTPLVAALANTDLALVTIIDERAAAFYALGAARATGKPAALVCTSGSAAAHYLPAIVEASHAGIPLIAITADRPPELQHCGASQTIDQHAIYGTFVRGAFDLGAPAGEPLALRAIRRSMIQAVTRALGPDPGPVHVNVPLRKPLEPAAPTTDAERAFAAVATELLAQRLLIAPPTLAPDARAIEALGRAIASEPRGLIVAGALPAISPPGFANARDTLFEIARRSGYPIVAEAGSQLRLCARPDDVTFVDAFDLIAGHAPRPALIVQLGAEPVAAAWPGFLRDAACTRFVLAGPRWFDPDASGTVVLGDISRSIRDLDAELALAERTSAASLRRRVEREAASLAWRDDWRALDQRGREALDRATRELPATEVAAIRDALAALPAGAMLQIGNSLPIRVVDHALLATRQHHADRPSEPRSGIGERGETIDPDSRWHAGLHELRSPDNVVITQRGAAGIDGLIASAAGATRAGRPVLLVLGDVSFAHDVGGLLAAREAIAPLAILVIDNGGGRIFDGLPVAKAGLGDAFAQHWTTAPQVEVVAVARALGVTAITASPETIGYDVTTAATTPGVTVIHAPVSPTGARDIRARAIELAAPRISRASQPAIARSSAPVIARTATGDTP
jgi:2-succinyl-5-enolpyruvyl-6-hydroxy-3-cyclohexene-1-carboxylate synthase